LVTRLRLTPTPSEKSFAWRIVGASSAAADAARVRGREGIGNLRLDVDAGFEGKRTAANAIGQRFALEILHDDERRAVVLALAVHGADVRV
jgi:hypothetical protein